MREARHAPRKALWHSWMRRKPRRIPCSNRCCRTIVRCRRFVFPYPRRLWRARRPGRCTARRDAGRSGASGGAHAGGPQALYAGAADRPAPRAVPSGVPGPRYPGTPGQSEAVFRRSPSSSMTASPPSGDPRRCHADCAQPAGRPVCHAHASICPHGLRRSRSGLTGSTRRCWHRSRLPRSRTREARHASPYCRWETWARVGPCSGSPLARAETLPSLLPVAALTVPKRGA